MHISPYEILNSYKRNISYLCVWECLAYVRILDHKKSKLTSRAYECIFIGYAINSKAYRFYYLKIHVIIESNDVDFLKVKFSFKLRISGGNSGGGSLPSGSITPCNTEHDNSIIEPMKSKWARTTKDFGHNFHTYTLEEDPTSLQEALTSLNADL